MSEKETGGLIDVASGEWVQEWGRIQQQPPDAVPTPVEGWNRLCGGGGGKIGPSFGWFVTLAANPGHGKSLMALNLGAHAVQQGVSIGFVSLEMSPESLATRLYAISTRKRINQFERGAEFNTATIQAALAWSARLKANGVRFIINRRPTGHLDTILYLMDDMREAGCRMFVVDYLQLVDTGDEDAIYRAVARIATQLRLWAHTHKSLVIGLSQFNRSTSSNYDVKPNPQGMHGGMALEANSDQVLLLDHSRRKRDDMSGHLSRTWLLLAKNRHGPMSEIPIEWDYHTLTVREGLPHEEHLWPGMDL